MEIRFMVIPEKYMRTKVVMTLITMDRPTTNVGLMLFRKSHRIRMARRPPKTRF